MHNCVHKHLYNRAHPRWCLLWSVKECRIEKHPSQIFFDHKLSLHMAVNSTCVDMFLKLLTI